MVTLSRFNAARRPFTFHERRRTRCPAGGLSVAAAAGAAAAGAAAVAGAPNSGTIGCPGSDICPGQAHGRGRR